MSQKFFFLKAIFSKVIIGLILLKAGITKLSTLQKFTEVVMAYKLLPEVIAKVFARILPVAEVVIGVMLLVGVMLPWSAIGAAILFLVFSGAIAINLLRGHRNISCGCFGFKQEDRLRWTMALRNIVFASLALISVGWWPNPSSLPKLFTLRPDPLYQLSAEETVVTILASCGVLAGWWLWSTFAILRRLTQLENPLPTDRSSD